METDILSTSNVVYVDRDFTNAQFGSKIEVGEVASCR